MSAFICWLVACAYGCITTSDCPSAPNERLPLPGWMDGWTQAARRSNILLRYDKTYTVPPTERDLNVMMFCVNVPVLSENTYLHVR